MPTKKSTPRPISKGSEDPAWLRLLETSSKGTFTEQHRSFEQLRELRRWARLSSGESATYRWIKQLKKEGKIRADRGYDACGKPTIKYIFVE